MATVDLSLFRVIPVGGAMKLQFRGEIFNLLNRANFGLPSNIVFNADGSYRGAAGRVTATSTTSRQIQFGLKLIW